MLRKKMFQDLNKNYEKVLKKLPGQLSFKAWKTALYSALLICWAIILAGTFTLIS